MCGRLVTAVLLWSSCMLLSTLRIAFTFVRSFIWVAPVVPVGWLLYRHFRVAFVFVNEDVDICRRGVLLGFLHNGFLKKPSARHLPKAGVLATLSCT
ncbi:hypothetical protein GGR51DRAFT_504779 [Nemania sp. FL0031]|nr:hypothetical protein GGR51DRAFT_504779 [Nemania sp. FL0031]